jgi:hypothetical protein
MTVAESSIKTADFRAQFSYRYVSTSSTNVTHLTVNFSHENQIAVHLNNLDNLVWSMLQNMNAIS